MVVKPENRVELTERDIEIFKHIARYGYTTYEVVQRLYFPGRDSSTLRGRIRQLKDPGPDEDGYIASEDKAIDNRSALYLTPRGARVVEAPKHAAERGRLFGRDVRVKIFATLSYCCEGLYCRPGKKPQEKRRRLSRARLEETLEKHAFSVQDLNPKDARSQPSNFIQAYYCFDNETGQIQEVIAVGNKEVNKFVNDQRVRFLKRAEHPLFAPLLLESPNGPFRDQPLFRTVLVVSSKPKEEEILRRVRNRIRRFEFELEDLVGKRKVVKPWEQRVEQIRDPKTQKRARWAFTQLRQMKAYQSHLITFICEDLQHLLNGRG